MSSVASLRLPSPGGSVRRLFLTVSALILTTSCTDAPVMPQGGGTGQAYLAVAPQFAALDEHNAVAAQQAAFDQVDNYRAVVRRIQSGEVVKDTTIQVAEGAQVHELTIPIQISGPSEDFILELTALDGTMVLFSVEATVTATSEGGAGGGGSTTPTSVTLEYTGPGAQAAALEFVPKGLVVGPGGTGTLRVRVLDDEGREISGVPLSRVSSAPATAGISGTTVSGVAEGSATLTVTTPSGLSATAPVHVVGGEVAYTSSGHVFQGPVGGTSATDRTPGVSGADQPAWHPGGGRLFYVAGGTVREAGASGPGLAGQWPSVSSDGSKLAVERGGTVWFANADGSLPTRGPAGSQPQWSGTSEVVVSGGSIERVGAESGTRTTVASGSGAERPAVGPGGRVAWIDGGGLFTSEGGGNLLPDGLVARSRPSWSPNGQWLVVSASGPSLPPTLHVLPSSGGPAVPLRFENTPEEGSPAWRPEGPAASPPAPSPQSLSPSRPLPGQEVEVQGTGFDGIIRGNNHVFFPTGGGSVEAEVLDASSTALRVVVPDGVSEGTLRVATFTGEGTLGIAPSVGNLEVVARTDYGKGVSGVEVRVTRNGQTVATGTTDSGGTASFGDLFTGTYGVEVTGVRDGFGATAPGGSHQVTLDGTTTVNLDVDVEIVELALTSSTPIELQAPGEEAEATAEARDVDGDAVPTAEIDWTSDATNVAGVTGSGPTVTVLGVTPGEATLTAAVAGLEATTEVSVLGAVTARVETRSGKGVSGSTLELRDGEEVLASGTTDENGDLRMTGLPRGEHRLVLAALRDGFVDPEGGAGRGVSLVPGSEEPEETFTVRAEVRSLSLSESELTLTAPGRSSMLEADPRDVDGDEVPDAEIDWSVSDGSVLALDEGTDGDGAALVAGTSIRVIGTGPGDAQVIAVVDQADASADVSVLGGVRGSVFYDYGEPFPDADLVLSRDGSEVDRTTSDEEGGFLFDELPVGDYQVQLVLPDGFTAVPTDVRDASVATGRPAPSADFQVDPQARQVELTLEETELQLGDEVPASVVANDARGLEIPNAEVDWISSDESVVRVEPSGAEGGGSTVVAGDGGASIVGGRTATVIAEGPGEARVTARVDEAEEDIGIQVRGAVRGTLIRPDGRPFEGGTVHLEQGAPVRDPVTTGSDGAFAFLDLDPGDYTLRIEVPAGFAVDGDNPREVTVGPGLGFLEILVRAGIQRVVISPAEPSVEVNGFTSVTATPLDVRGEPVTSVRSVRWEGLTSHLTASGSNLTGTLRGRFPTGSPGQAGFRITVDGNPFDFDATVTSFIEGTVTDGDGNGRPSVRLDLYQNERLVATTASGFQGAYKFDGLAAGTYTVMPVAPEGETASPSSATRTLGGETPSATVDFLVSSGVGPVELAGRPVLVFGSYPSRTTVANELQALGMNVTLASSLPSDVSPYHAIFHIDAFNALNAAERSRLEVFVKSGRGLHLTGERPCCETMNNAHELLINALVAGGGVQLGGLGDFSGSFPFNGAARGSITSVPNALSSWFPSAPGGMAGISGANVLATHSGTGTPVGAVWADGDMSSGSGRLTVLMDVNWPGSSNTRAVLENLATFLVRGVGAGSLRAPGQIRYMDVDSRREPGGATARPANDGTTGPVTVEPEVSESGGL